MTAGSSHVTHLLKGIATLRGTRAAVSFGGSIGSLGALNTGGSKSLYRPPVAGRQGGLGDYHGNSGAVTHGPSTFGSEGGLGYISGSSGSITHGAGRPPGAIGSILGVIGGDPGVVSHLGGNSSYTLGATSGSPGAVARLAGNSTYGLGATGGSSGAVTRLGGNSSYGLGATGGNSGSISRLAGNSSYNLGATGGDSGAITRSSGIGNYLGATGGNPGAVSRLAGNSTYGLGGLGGSSGAINRGISTIQNVSNRTPTGNTGRRSSTPARSGSLGSTGGLGARGTVGSGTGKGVRRRTRAARPPVHSGTCCGLPVTGRMALAVDWGFDEKGNELPPLVREWVCQIGGVDWTPDNWQDYIELYNKFGYAFDVTESPTTFIQESAMSFSACCEWAMDAPDAYGRRFGTRSMIRALGQQDPMHPAIPGRSIVPVRVLVWPPA